ncbi:hypothetical protein FAVG1_01978 [Fusarium avenaceum]|nr:hypothetical protein FAVG1_01978 [Fusarium avenaceum]
MDFTEYIESNSDSSLSLTSSIFAEHHDAPLVNFYSFDQVMDKDNYDHPAPPTANISASTILEGTAVIRSSYAEADDVSMDDWTIINPSVASEITCPAPTSVSVPVSTPSVAGLTASNMFYLERQDTQPSEPISGPGSHVVSGLASDDMNETVWVYSNSFTIAQDGQGLCGIGAWADIATSPLAGKMGVIPRQ